MKQLGYIHFRNRGQFRKWLGNYHEKSEGLWMVFFKNDPETPCITYQEALEEALCFGWIDSIIRKLDDRKYVRKFTPRKNTKNWSVINQRIVKRLIDEGKMTEAGLQKIDSYRSTGTVEWTDQKTIEKVTNDKMIPGFILEEFASNEPALVNFNRLAPIYKKHYVLWITSAKREETIRRRIQESVSLLKENKKLGLK